MLAPTTRLDVINMMLSGIGLRPVTADQLESKTRSEVTMAVNLLEDVTREVQSSGWGFNTENAYPFVPNEEGEILLPPGLLKIEGTPHHPGLTMRRRSGTFGKQFYLYDPHRHSFTFKQTVYADVVWQFEFEDLPEPFRRYILIRSGRMFQDRVSGSHSQHMFQERDEMIALSALRNSDNQTTQPNMLNFKTFPLMRR